jgi:hypothetical protein
LNEVPNSNDLIKDSSWSVSWLQFNRSASVAPWVSDDNTAWYSIGSRWIDTTADKEYVALDVSTWAAVWIETTQSGLSWDVTITWTLRVTEWLETNDQTGTTYTLVIWDAWKVVTLTNAAAITLTIPTNASVAFAVWTIINFEQLGAGQVTFGWAWVTINSKDSNLSLTGQFSGAYLRKTATDTWLLLGDLA